MKWKRLGYLLGIAIPTILGIVPASPVHAQSIELPIDFTVNVKNYLNVRNGIAGLDANASFGGDITDSLLKRTGGTGSESISKYFVKTVNSKYDLSQLPNQSAGSGPLATVVASASNGDVLNFGDVFFPYANNSMVPHEKDKSLWFNFLGNVNHYGSGYSTSYPGSFIADDSISSGFWPGGYYGDEIHGSINYRKYVPLSHDDSGNLLDTTNGDSTPDYAPVVAITNTVADKYPAANWGGRNDVPSLFVSATENAGSNASTVPIIASLTTNGVGGFFANSVALKTYTFNYGINSSWGIDTRIEDHYGLEPHNDGKSGAGYNIIGNEIDVQTYGQDEPNVQYIPFGYRAGLHFGLGGSSTDEAQYGSNVCAYHVGDRVLMPEYDASGNAIVDPWGNPLKGVFKVISVGGTCASGNGKTGSIPASSWVRGAGASNMWTQQSDGTYKLVASSLPSITSGDTVFVWGEDEATTVGSVIRVEGTSVKNDFEKGNYGGTQFGAGLFMSGAYLDAAIDLSSMECGIPITSLIGGKQTTVPQTNCAAIRMPKDIGIDFSSTYDFHGSTALADAVASQNTHVLKYDSSKSALTYLINGSSSLFSLTDSNEVKEGSVNVIYDSASGQTHYQYGNAAFDGNRFNPTGAFKESGTTVIPDTTTSTSLMSWVTFNDASSSAGYSWYSYSPYASPSHLKLIAHLNSYGFTVNTQSSLDSGAITTDGSGNMTVVSVSQSPVALSSITTPKTGQSVFDSASNTMWFYTGTEWHHSDPIRTAYTSLPTAGKYVGEAYYCTDCYSKLREDGDTQTGIVLYWNGTSFRDALGIDFNHP